MAVLKCVCLSIARPGCDVFFSLRPARSAESCIVHMRGEDILTAPIRVASWANPCRVWCKALALLVQVSAWKPAYSSIALVHVAENEPI